MSFQGINQLEKLTTNSQLLTAVYFHFSSYKHVVLYASNRTFRLMNTFTLIARKLHLKKADCLGWQVCWDCWSQRSSASKQG